MLKHFLLYIALTSCYILSFSQDIPVYKDQSQPIEKRVHDLLQRMTPEEKFWQLFMIPGDLDNVTPSQYQHGLFGFQVSAGAKGDAGGQLLNYSTNENARVLAKK